jgi:hypothetical protein
MSFRDNGLEILEREMARLKEKDQITFEDTRILCSLVEAYMKLCTAPPNPPDKGKQARVLNFRKTKDASLIASLKKTNG